MAMARNSLMIAIGVPRPARDDEEDYGDPFYDQGTEETLSRIYSGLREGDEKTAHAALDLAKCLEQMAHAAMRGNQDKLKEWNEHCCEIVSSLYEDSDGEEDD
jgi:hypothetical protein